MMKSLLAAARRLIARISTTLVLAAAAARAWGAWQRHRRAGADRRSMERDTLPSLYDVHPAAGRAPRRAIGLRSVPLVQIVGTMRHPSQNTADFLPLPRLRGTNWRGR